MGLQRAARTDAGVHAAGNVVSMKIIPSVPGVPDLVARVNEELPPEIRLWGFVRVSPSCYGRLDVRTNVVLLFVLLSHGEFQVRTQNSFNARTFVVSPSFEGLLIFV